ncbi:MAG: DUF559 domain-containing protein [Candidatus Peribacteraceae bacterium]|nr:DUF559 domain-containing protein [Candidatus Peribacteraceae bacterium]MDD5739733.1 DUF559 domain-containing protein [Candidatus Peribacteraceae bacterium]
MFTGIIETTAKIIAQGDGRLTLERPVSFDDVKPGSSIAVSGVCLTVVGMDERSLTFDVMPETIRKTTIGDLAIGDFVNLERALPAHGRFEGHVVQGHIEGTGEVIGISSIPRPLPPQEEGEKERRWKKLPTPRNILSFARDMRKQPPKAEDLLWPYLRDDQLGCRFRRQYPLGGRILDFFCPRYRIAIELDGGIHHTHFQKNDDSMRDQYLREEYGVITLRLENDEVESDIHVTMEKIHAFVRRHSSSPSLVERGLGGEENPERGSGGEENQRGGDVRLTIRIPSELRRMIVPKGSLCLDGVSLTVADVGVDSCTVALIPMTLKGTTLGTKRMGDSVNIETDILIRMLVAQSNP